MTVSKSLAKIVLATALVGLLIAMALAPVAGISGVAIARTNASMESDVDELSAGEAPGVTVVKDADGNNLAYIYQQRRHPVIGDQISQYMKDAIVSIEDQRFYEHEGVDFQGNFRALATNVLAGGVQQGASTLNQQYVKNFLLLVRAQTPEEQQAATEQSVGRKLREIRMAADIDKKLSKDEILTNYLNLVPFGNHAYGIEAAARTYFGISAAELSLPQAAMLAGMVQSSEYLNPYTNAEGVTERRNLVLNSMASNGVITQEEADAAAGQELGVLETPATLPNGCIGAGDRGFFCDYVLQYLNEKGLDDLELSRGGYTINTTLRPNVQDAAKQAIDSQVNPNEPGVAGVMNVLQPSPNSREVTAMVSSRTYGLDLEAGQTILPQPYSMVGNGAGSVFKVFTAAAALEAGYGVKSQLDVPERYEAEGLGHGGAEDCPPTRYCVENAGNYRAMMTLQDNLAQSPNTSFIKLEEQVGIAHVVDMAVKLGLRSYTDMGTYGADNSVAQFAKDAPMGSFTLGPTSVDPLELSNVGATIASGGKWCEPDPIKNVIDKDGNEVYIEETPCEQAISFDVANALANALSSDSVNGTAANAANAMGFGGRVAAKTGTTESNQSAAFLGFNSKIAAAPYIYNDGTTTTPLCANPARQCGEGTLFGGEEPARAFFSIAGRIAADGAIADYNRDYDKGTSGEEILDQQRNRGESEAKKTLEDRGYTVKVTRVNGDGVAFGRVVRALRPNGGLKEGAEIVLQVSDGMGAPSIDADGTPDQSQNAQQWQQPAEQPAPQPQQQAPAPQAPQAPPPIITRDEVDRFANDLRNMFGIR